MSGSELIYAGIESVLNRYLSLDPQAMERLAQLHGKVIALEISGTGLHCYLIPAPQRLLVVGQHEGEADCRMRGSPLALARMANHKRNSEQLFGGEVVLTGDTELAHRFGNILADMDVDWEEQLARVSGDTLAHSAGNLWRGFSGWGRTTADNLGLDIQEYLQEELRMLPPRLEVTEFMDQVDRLRDDTERLEAAIRRAQRRLGRGDQA